MTDYPFNPVLDKCEAGHHYYKRSDRMESSCPYCLKRGLELARAENEKLKAEVERLKSELHRVGGIAGHLVALTESRGTAR